MKSNIFTKAKAKVKNYTTNKNLERFEKYRSKKLGKPYVPASKKNKGFKKYDSSYKRKESPFMQMSKQSLSKISSQLKKASKLHAGQAAKIDKATSSMKMKTPMKKISGPCKAAAKRKFKVWPSAYASGWGVRCTKAGGPSKFGG